MNIKAQTCMVLNLDKCLGCQTCTVTCKNVWTTRPGLDYAWFNNVETKPGSGYPSQWESQRRYKGGWRLDRERLALRQGGRLAELAGLFANRNLPAMRDYYEPFTFNFSSLHKGRYRTPPTARPFSIVTGRRMEKIENGPNWEDDLSGTFARRSADPCLEGMDTQGMDTLEASFMVYLPRLCEHCLNPACVASCPSGAIYKREEDGVVLIDQERCRGWRMCVSACPFKKIYYNFTSHRSEKCNFCYPRTENGMPTVCSHTCPGRIRYIGVMLYDQDRVKEAASTADPQKLYEAQLDMFLDPDDPEVAAQAERQGIDHNVMLQARHSPVYKLMKEWRVAFPLHPEYRTLPMQWYIPQLSPLSHPAAAADAQEGAQADGGDIDLIPDPEKMRVPLQYMANLLTAGDTAPLLRALRAITAMRRHMRRREVPGYEPKNDANPGADTACDLTESQLEEMYRLLAIADYEERFRIPTRDINNAPDNFQTHSNLGFPHTEGPDRTPRNLFAGL